MDQTIELSQRMSNWIKESKPNIGHPQETNYKDTDGLRSQDEIVTPLTVNKRKQNH